MIDIHAKSNVEWTDSHVNMMTKNGITNIVKVLVECKHLKFPTSNQILKAEKELAALERKKNTVLHNPNNKRKNGNRHKK